MTDATFIRAYRDGTCVLEERSSTSVLSQSGLPFLLSVTGPLVPTESIGRTLNLILKRALDIILSLVALVFLSLPLVVVAAAIRMTSPGPALFVQVRPGLRGAPFKILKFRTMYLDQSDAAGSIQAVAGDKRVTPLGRILRRTSVDELPQLINVLVGDMSLVGPRPHPVKMLAGGVDYRVLVNYYDLRLLVRPGLTGWAQAHGLRGETVDTVKARARIDHDLAYIQNLSVLLDLRIVWLTLRHEFLRSRGG